MAQHTPEPWTKRVGYSDGEPLEYVIDAGAQTLASVYSQRDERSGRREANADLCVAAPALLRKLRSLEHLASVLNSRQDAGLKITPVMWSELSRECEEAQAIIHQADPP